MDRQVQIWIGRFGEARHGWLRLGQAGKDRLDAACSGEAGRARND